MLYWRMKSEGLQLGEINEDSRLLRRRHAEKNWPITRNFS